MATRLRRWVGSALVAVALLTAVAAPTAWAQNRVELTPAVQASLLDLQELWIEWLASFNQGNPERSGELLDEILENARQLGMTELPDLADGALAAASSRANAGDFARARLALVAAERLAPGQPENSFARARVEAQAGRWFHAAGNWLGGQGRVLTRPEQRRFRLSSAMIQSLVLLLLAGTLFTALLMAVHGRRVVAELSVLVGGGRLPAWLSVLLAALLLLWPLALPAGLAWLILYWSVLLFAHSTTSERVVLVVFWLVAGLSPLISAQARHNLSLELAPPVRALDDVVEGRLQGSLFSDLGLLEELLPTEPAVDHLLGDVHRRLGQWERARTRYLRVLDSEPENSAALVDLASYYFYKGDYGTALSRYREAIEVAPDDADRAVAFFNLSQTLLVEYLFEEGGEALISAKALAGTAGVETWLAETGEGSVLNANGGLARRPELRDALAAMMAGDEGGAGRTVVLVRRTWSILVSLGLLLAAFAYAWISRRLRRDDAVPATPSAHPGVWPRALLPGLTSVTEGRGGLAFLASLTVALWILVGWHARIGFAPPLGYAPGQTGPTVAFGLLAVFLAVRAWRMVRGEA